MLMGHSPMYIEERNKKMGLTVAKAHKSRGEKRDKHGNLMEEVKK